MSDASLAKRFRVDGRSALVTGGSSVLGAEIARSLHEAGARIVIAARRTDRLAALAAELPGCLAVTCDLADPASRKGLVAEAVGHNDRVDILVNVAGTIDGAVPADTESLAGIGRTLEVNLVAPLHLAQLVQPGMRAAGRGAIINIGSISGLVGIPGIPQASYAASKQGLLGLSRELAAQWGRHGIRVNVVAAGFFRSEMSRELFDDPTSAAWLDRGTLLPGHVAVEDVADAVVWLAADSGRQVTGQAIVVDGGWTTR